jgi:hypothetical protein
MVTVNGARALLWENEIGSLEVGKKADIVIVNPHTPNMLVQEDIISFFFAHSVTATSRHRGKFGVEHAGEKRGERADRRQVGAEERHGAHSERGRNPRSRPGSGGCHPFAGGYQVTCTLSPGEATLSLTYGLGISGRQQKGFHLSALLSFW